ncbi:MAG: transglutaminaseTgpA domain-containing protein [Polyangiaceae bacterium]
MTDSLAALGLLALITSGELNHWLAIAILVGLAFAVVIPESFQDRPLVRRIGVALPLALLGAQAVRLFMGASLLETAVEFAAGLQVIRLGTRRGAAHDQQVIVLALLHLIAATVLGSGLAYGLCFLGFLVIAPGALVLSHLRREVEGNYRQGARDRTGLPVDVPRILRSRRVIGRSFLVFTCLLSVPIFLFTLGLFVAFPRVGLSLLLLSHPKAERMVGFTEHVDLGGVGRLRSDPTIVMRVDVPNLPKEPPPRVALYLRGAAFDSYRGKSWSRSLGGALRADQHGRQVQLLRFPDPLRDRTMHIDLEPIEPAVVFLPPEAVALTVAVQGASLLNNVPQVTGGPEGSLTYKTQDERGLRYDVSLAGPDEPTSVSLLPNERPRYLTLPTDLPPRVAELARAWIGGTKDPRLEARLIEARLRKDYRYDVDSPSGAAKNPLYDFLFVSKRGHCEFYSTAMAILLRTQGVPTRNVTGFIGGTYNRFARSYAVRQGDAHSWVEVYLDDTGWTRFDPTPPASAAPQSDITGLLAFVRDFVEATTQRWNRHVIGYDLKQQVGLLRSMHRGYSALRDRPGTVGKLLSSPRLTLLAAIGLIGLGYGVFWLSRRRKALSPAARAATERETAAREVVELYRQLEAALAARGVPRPTGTPPRAHAASLAGMGHPTGEEALALTELYLAARFGRDTLDADQRRDFSRRVRALRVQRVTSEKAAA